jgi:hypothetical protein
MDRADKIFTVLAMLALVGVVVHRHCGCPPRDDTRLDVSVATDAGRGPAYLLSALPSHRRNDDFLDPISFGPPEGLT